ncbi:MAG: FMN-binding protein [Candidatus Izemoplasmatales bacterium]
MKIFFKNYGLLMGLIAILIGIFAIGGIYSRYVTNQHAVLVAEAELSRLEAEQEAARVASYLALFAQGTKVEKYTSETVDKTYNLSGDRGEFSPSIIDSYHIYNGDVEIGVVYVVSSKGHEDGLNIAFAIDIATDTCIGVVVIANAETQTIYSTLTDTWFTQFENFQFDTLSIEIDAVAEATESSKGFEIGLLYAREVYAVEYGFEIPTTNITIVSMTYNYNPDTFANAVFIADVIHGEDNTAVSVYLSRTYDYVGIVGDGVTLTIDEQTVLKTIASASGLVSNKSWFVSYNVDTRVLVMNAKGFKSTPIVVTITLNATLDGIEGIPVITSSETYDENEYGDYAGGPAPEVENNLINQYLDDGNIVVDGVADATITSNAMKQLIYLLDNFISTLTGDE